MQQFLFLNVCNLLYIPEVTVSDPGTTWGSVFQFILEICCITQKFIVSYLVVRSNLVLGCHLKEERNAAKGHLSENQKGASRSRICKYVWNPGFIVLFGL